LIATLPVQVTPSICLIVLPEEENEEIEHGARRRRPGKTLQGIGECGQCVHQLPEKAYKGKMITPGPEHCLQSFDKLPDLGISSSVMARVLASNVPIVSGRFAHMKSA